MSNDNSSIEELLKEAKAANFSKLSDLFHQRQFDDKEVDLGFRMLLKHYVDDNENYFKSLKLFMKNTNVNYQSPLQNNSTILIETIRLGLFSPAEKLIKYFKYLEVDSKLNVNCIDDDGDTCLFKLVSSKLFHNEDERYNLFTELISESPSVTQVNKEGHSLLSLAFVNGNYFICEELIRRGYDVHHVVESTGDNMIHCAVKGENALCVNLIKNIMMGSDEGRVEMKNRISGELPIDLAKRRGLKTIVQLLGSAKDYCQMELLGEYSKGNYAEILKTMGLLRKEDQLDNVRLQWNNLLVEYMMEYFSKEKDVISNGIGKNKNSISTSFYSKVVAFFQKEDNDNHSHNHSMYPVITLNNIILKYKLGNYPDITSIFMEYLTSYNIIKNNASSSSSPYNNLSHWLCYVIGSLISIEEFICINKTGIVDQLINNLTVFLNNTKAIQSDNKIICEYLNSNETLNPQNTTEDIITLFTSYKHSAQGDISKAKNCLRQFKEKFLNKKSSFPIQATLKQLYLFLQIKVLYQENQTEKCYERLNDIIVNSNNNTNSNSKLFYYNSLGILNLRSKQLKYAEFCFRQCDKILKTEDKKEQRLQSLTNYKPCIWYNIGLCYFYAKNYEKALKIFLNAKILKKCRPNPCLYFRLGLCYLERELITMKKETVGSYMNDLIVRIEEMNGKDDNEDCGEDSNKNSTSMNNDDKDKDKGKEDNGIEGKGDMKIILRTKMKDNQNENIIEAINYFKEAIFLIKEKNVYTYDMANGIPFSDQSNPSSSKAASPLSSEKEVIKTSYLNLLFCLTLLDNWTEIIFYANEFKQNEFYSNDIDHILNNFLIEAYVNLNYHTQALELLKEDMNESNSNDNSYGNVKVYSKHNQTGYNEVRYKVALYANFIKISMMNLKENKMDIEKSIITLLKLLKSDNDNKRGDIPPYIMSIIIYYLLLSGNGREASRLIRNRILPKKMHLSI